VCAALDVANDVIMNVRADVKTGLSSPAVTVSTTRVIYMTFLQISVFTFVEFSVTFMCVQSKQFYFSCIIKFH
jgi:hypothetical protein